MAAEKERNCEQNFRATSSFEGRREIETRVEGDREGGRWR